MHGAAATALSQLLEELIPGAWMLVEFTMVFGACFFAFCGTFYLAERVSASEDLSRASADSKKGTTERRDGKISSLMTRLSSSSSQVSNAATSCSTPPQEHLVKRWSSSSTTRFTDSASPPSSLDPTMLYTIPVSAIQRRSLLPSALEGTRALMRPSQPRGCQPAALEDVQKKLRRNSSLTLTTPNCLVRGATTAGRGDSERKGLDTRSTSSREKGSQPARKVPCEPGQSLSYTDLMQHRLVLHNISQ